MRRITARTKLTFVSDSPPLPPTWGPIRRVYTKTHSTGRDNAKLKLSLGDTTGVHRVAIWIDKSSGLHGTPRRVHLPLRAVKVDPSERSSTIPERHHGRRRGSCRARDIHAGSRFFEIFLLECHSFWVERASKGIGRRSKSFGFYRSASGARTVANGGRNISRNLDSDKIHTSGQEGRSPE